MTTPSQKSQKTVVYLFGLHLSKSLADANAHDQLYEAFKPLKDDWYQATDDESRRIQFIQKENALVCRSSVEPRGLEFLAEHVEVSNGDQIKVNIRLPAMRRLKRNNVTRTIPIKKEDKVEYYSGILNRNGISVDKLEWVGRPANTVFFTQKKAKVAIPVDDVSAVITITDAAAFINAMQCGVGRYKTYGCGMIVIVKDEG